MESSSINALFQALSTRQQAQTAAHRPQGQSGPTGKDPAAAPRRVAVLETLPPRSAFDANLPRGSLLDLKV
ncbi:MAG: hypothetical protein ACTSXZ_09675 [Alphaproteobacteria bacterium]